MPEPLFLFHTTITIEQLNVIIGELTEQQQQMYADYLQAMKDRVQKEEEK